MILLLSINNSNLQSEIAHHQVKFSPRRVHIKCRAEMDGQTETYIILRVGAHFHANLLGMCKFPALEHLSAGRRIERRRLTYSRSPSALYKNKYFPLPRIVFASLIIIYRCLRAAKKRRAAGDRQKNRVSPAARGKFCNIHIHIQWAPLHGRGYIKWSLRIHVCKKLARKAAFPGTHGNAPAAPRAVSEKRLGGGGRVALARIITHGAPGLQIVIHARKTAPLKLHESRASGAPKRPAGRASDLCVCVLQ
jgi:hypothetical protein